MSTTAEERELFNNRGPAEAVARKIGFPGDRWHGPPESRSPTTRFAYFSTNDDLLVVAGDQEKSYVDLALAHGLTLKDQGGHRRLVLALPKNRALPTLQRAAWLNSNHRPVIHLHHDGDTHEQPHPIPTPEETVTNVIDGLKGVSPTDEFKAATTPLDLGPQSKLVIELAEWATRHRLLDQGHRQSERAWLCIGQKVLSMKQSRDTVRIKAGIHHGKRSSGEAPKSIEVSPREPLPSSGYDELVSAVEEAITKRREHGDFYRPDEHWLQAVLRRSPTILGVEHPVHREVPAKRPVARSSRWGRGYIDLVGLDAHGDIRLIETKLSTNDDDLFIFQGLDYYVYALAYQEPIRQWLNAPVDRSEFTVHYVVGAAPDSDEVTMSRYARAQAEALEIPWTFQTVTQWWQEPIATPTNAHVWPKREFPNPA